MDIEARKAVVARHLRDVRWEGEVGFAECPGVQEHTHPNQPRDCKIYVSGTTVTVHCFHESCAELIGSINRLIRSELAGLPGELTKAERREYAKTTQDVSQVARGILETFDKIYATYWRGPELLARALGPEESQAHFFGLYKDSDIIWIGDVHHSGFVGGLGHFRSVAHWKVAPRYWEYTATGIFNFESNVWRAKRMVVRQDYRVIEFDHLDPEPLANQLKSCALYFYLAETFGLEGKVAILSGKKSVHFWVRNNPDLFTDSFMLFLKTLGADPALFRAYQPVRFPGVIRAETNKPQSLIIL